MKKLSNAEAVLEKSVANKKGVYSNYINRCCVHFTV